MLSVVRVVISLVLELMVKGIGFVFMIVYWICLFWLEFWLFVVSVSNYVSGVKFL